MWRITLTLCVYLQICLHIPEIHAAADVAQCAFADTVNVTGDPILLAGFHQHDGLLIPPNLITMYDYVHNSDGERIKVEPHKRACICLLRSCINVCCPWGLNYDIELQSCQPTAERFQWPQPLLNVTLFNGSERSVNIFEQFSVQYQRPCQLMYALEPDVYETDEWHLQWNGELQLLKEYKKYDKNQYCLVPTTTDPNGTQYIINPVICAEVEPEGNSIQRRLNASAMFFSIPFMLLTIIVYLWLPELCCQLGKCLICYLICLIIGNATLLYLTFINIDWLLKSCRLVGYIGYYAFMGAFFWLSAISFYLWHTFCSSGIISSQQQHIRFYKYSLYAWGLAAACTLLTWYAQERADIAEHLRPGIGSEGFCWIKMINWSAMIYFYGPILLIILTNMIMFILTARKIHRAHPDKEKFGLFLRLFIIMGLTWSLEILSYLVGSSKPWTKIFLLSDLLNGLQGLLIFLLFVMRKNVFNLIKERFSKSRKVDNTIYSETVQMKDVPADEINDILLLQNNAKLEKSH